jgi:hypothetical protein
MKILLQRKIATHKWDTVADFLYFHDAQACAKLLSKLDECKYRIVDKRWFDDGDEIIFFFNGEIVE